MTEELTVGYASDKKQNPKGFTDFNDMAVKSGFGQDGEKNPLGAKIEFPIERQKEAWQRNKEQEKNATRNRNSPGYGFHVLSCRKRRFWNCGSGVLRWVFKPERVE